MVDDAYQGVNCQIVRGADLLDNTPRQLYLQHLLSFAQPTYAHVPLAIDSKTSKKLSKQNLAPAIDAKTSISTLIQSLTLFGTKPTRSNGYQSAKRVVGLGDCALVYTSCANSTDTAYHVRLTQERNQIFDKGGFSASLTSRAVARRIPLTLN